MLTAEQKDTLKTYILNDPILSQWTSGPGTDFWGITVAMNQTATPDFTVWKTAVTRSECMTNGFDYAQVDNLTVGQARIWDWLFNRTSETMNPSDTGVRNGITECWKGTAAKLSVQLFVFERCKRLSTVAEQVLAVGTGSNASPASLTFEGQLSLDDISSMFL